MRVEPRSQAIWQPEFNDVAKCFGVFGNSGAMPHHVFESRSCRFIHPVLMFELLHQLYCVLYASHIRMLGQCTPRQRESPLPVGL
jgi:hypothetical protein